MIKAYKLDFQLARFGPPWLKTSEFVHSETFGLVSDLHIYSQLDPRVGFVVSPCDVIVIIQTWSGIVWVDGKWE